MESGITVQSLTIKIVDTRTLKETQKDLQQGKSAFELSLEAGTYNFLITGKDVTDFDLLGAKDAVVIKEDMTLTIPLKRNQSKMEDNSGLRFGDIFFNGETNARMMHPDQYFMVVNNGEITIPKINRIP